MRLGEKAIVVNMVIGDECAPLETWVVCREYRRI